MEKKRVALAVYFLIALVVVSLTAFLVINYIKRWALISQQRSVALQIRQDVTDYQRLGFDDGTELISLLQGRVQRTQERIKELENTWFVLKARPEPTEVAKKNIEKLILINKKMLMSYIKDVKEYRKLGLPASHTIIKFAYDKVVRLTIALAELERQLHGNSKSNTNEYLQRLERMQEINQQSITQFKHELHGYLQSGFGDDNPKIQFVRAQITRKVRALHQLEYMLLD